MLRNTGLRFICRFVRVRVERADTPFTSRFAPGQVVRMPIAHNEGRYIPCLPAGRADAKTVRAVQGQVVFRYCDDDGQSREAANPNGSTDWIAGITNRAGNVMGMMPHPERSAEPELGSTDGRLVFESMLEALAHA
jgi:phosphoribosylformylglycinamidine synthase